MTRRKFDVAMAKVDKCAQAKGFADSGCCDEWRECPLMYDMCTEGVRASERAIKRLDKDLSTYHDEQYQKQLIDALESRWQTLDKFINVIEIIVGKWWSETDSTSNDKPAADINLDFGNYFGELYKDGEYVILGGDDARNGDFNG
jgi:hypothetical protein